jgi:uncharacterized protein (DUF697 family)
VVWTPKLSPAALKKLAGQRLNDVVVREIPRARKRVEELERSYPSAEKRELGQRLVDSKKNVAGMVGGVSGIFGLASVPADLLVMTWLQLALLVDLATLFKVNLKSEQSRQELFDIFGYANGIGPVTRAGPKVLGKLVGTLLQRGGLETLGRAMPLVAAPVTAYLNNQHIQAVGEEALRRYQSFGKAQAKTKARGKGDAS